MRGATGYVASPGSCSPAPRSSSGATQPQPVAAGGPGCVPKVEELMELCIDFPLILDAADTPVVKGVLDAAERHNYTTPELEELRMRFIKYAEHRRGRLTIDFVCHVRS